VEDDAAADHHSVNRRAGLCEYHLNQRSA
jgi:hypothetical protein